VFERSQKKRTKVKTIEGEISYKLVTLLLLMFKKIYLYVKNYLIEHPFPNTVSWNIFFTRKMSHTYAECDLTIRD
jgi:hypothetical protein